MGIIAKKSVALPAVLCLLAAGSLARADTAPPLPSAEEVKALVDAGQYRDALKPLFRLLELKGNAALPYDRYELLMLRHECQLQIRDHVAVVATLTEARTEAFTTDKPERAALPTAMAFLIERSTAFQYKSKSNAAQKPISILDRTLRPAAYAALLADELPAAKQKIQAVTTAKTLGPLLDAAKLAGAIRALEVVSKPETDKKNPDKLDTDSLTAAVTTNADRLLLTEIQGLDKTADAINATANQIINTQQGQYDPVSKKSWMVPVTVRRGVNDQETQTLQAVESTCDKIHATAIDLAVALATDFSTYKELVDKSALVKQKANVILHQDYSIVPK